MLCHRAKLGALNGAQTRKAFIARKKTDGSAVIFFKNFMELFGVIGMIFAVPLVSVLYVLIKDDVARRLKKKSSPEASKSE